MRHLTVHGLGLSLLALLGACSVVAPPHAIAGRADDTPPAKTPTAKPAGKLSPQMAGTVSPIPAFIGQGDGWRLEIRALDATQHHVAVHWTGANGAHTDSGTARYGGALDLPRGSPRALEGRLHTREGAKALRIDIRTEPCTDTAGTPRPQRVALAIEGRALAEGCGDLAMY